MTHVTLRNIPDAVSGNQVILFLLFYRIRIIRFPVKFNVMLFSMFGILPKLVGCSDFKTCSCNSLLTHLRTGV